MWALHMWPCWPEQRSLGEGAMCLEHLLFAKYFLYIFRGDPPKVT